MPFTGPIEDRQAIRDLYGDYADASARGDRAQWLACFTSDGRWRSHIFDVAGTEALIGQWDSLWATFAAIGFISDVNAIEVSGDAALGRCTCREVVRLADGSLMKLIGRYEDQLVRSAGGWRFALRHYILQVDEITPPA